MHFLARLRHVRRRAKRIRPVAGLSLIELIVVMSLASMTVAYLGTATIYMTREARFAKRLSSWVDLMQKVNGRLSNQLFCDDEIASLAPNTTDLAWDFPSIGSAGATFGGSLGGATEGGVLTAVSYTTTVPGALSNQHLAAITIGARVELDWNVGIIPAGWGMVLTPSVRRLDFSETWWVNIATLAGVCTL